MYEPEHFKVHEAARLHALMAAHPLGLLVSAGAQGLLANAVPFQFFERLEHGILQGHVARANTQWRDLAGGLDVLVVFQGVDRYISPSLYASKPEHGKVVPTWNYVMVQARGRAEVHEDASWLRQQIGAITDRQEASRVQPWAVSDAPDNYVAMQMRAIVGIEIELTGLIGKFKVSQNRSAEDRASVLAGLEAGGTALDKGMADMLRPFVRGNQGG